MARVHKLSLLLVALLWSGCKLESDSVLPLQIAGREACTAFSINEANGFWLTAGHCVDALLESGEPLSIRNSPVVVIFRAPLFDDLAVVQSAFKAPALVLAPHAPRVTNQVYVVGYPYGLGHLLHTQGVISGRMVPLGFFYPPSDILDVTIAGGNSGSPVCLHNRTVVGMIWGSLHDASPISVAVPWETLKRLVGGYWEGA